MVKVTIGMTNYNTLKLKPFKVLSYKFIGPLVAFTGKMNDSIMDF